MKNNTHSASAKLLAGQKGTETDFFRESARPSAVEFSRSEIKFWALFFAAILFLLMLVLAAGKYFMPR